LHSQPNQRLDGLIVLAIELEEETEDKIGGEAEEEDEEEEGGGRRSWRKGEGGGSHGKEGSSAMNSKVFDDIWRARSVCTWESLEERGSGRKRRRKRRRSEGRVPERW